MVARNAENFVTPLAQPFEEAAGLLELLGPGALGEVAADHHQVGLQLVDAAIDGLDQPLIVSAEVEVGQMDEPRHGL